VSGMSGNPGAISGSLFEDYFRIADNPLVTCGTVCFVGSSILSSFGLLWQ
jgi:hypothetical protein